MRCIFAREHKVVWVLLSLIGLIVGCASTADDPLADRSFLTGQPCQPPCWYGLTLDKSNKEDVLTVLKGLPFVDQATVKTPGTVWLGDERAVEIRFGCTHPMTDPCGGALVSTNVVKQIWISVGYSLRFEKVVAQLGPPEYVDYGVYHPEAGGCSIELGWPEKGISVQSLDTSSDTQCRFIRETGHMPSNVQATILIYSVKEGFSSKPGGCCTRIKWPGFAQP